MMTEEVACSLCGSSGYRTIATGTDREYGTTTDECWILGCLDCGLLYLSPRPRQSELGRIYPKAYHSYILKTGTGTGRWRGRAAKKRFRRILLDHFVWHGMVRVLDVGCGNGWSLDLFQSVAPRRIDPMGVEIDRTACRIARHRGHQILEGRFEDVELPHQFDLINMTHVIEHLADPKAAVAKAAAALDPGGHLVLETPNTGAWEFRFFRQGAWGAYHIPRHWHFYNHRTIEQLGKSAGLRLVAWYCHPGPTHWVWTFHNLALARHWKWVERLFDPVRIFRGGMVATVLLAAFYALDRLALALGAETSVMTAVFEKPSH